ncbi:MAG: hypothetical protein J6S97_00160 [Bacteroidales bacterium]|nr:hypothetical protein [Bacteroidales bacterium]
MKRLIIILLSIFVSVSAFASGNKPSGQKATLGILGGTNAFTRVHHGDVWRFTPGGSIFFDYPIAELASGHFTIGAQTGFQSWHDKHLDFSIAPRFTLGWDVADWCELHLGAIAGLGFSNWRTGKPHDFGFSYGGFLGAQFFVSDAIGITIEGGASSFSPEACVGVVFKL